MILDQIGHYWLKIIDMSYQSKTLNGTWKVIWLYLLIKEFARFGIEIQLVSYPIE